MCFNCHSRRENGFFNFWPVDGFQRADRCLGYADSGWWLSVGKRGGKTDRRGSDEAQRERMSDGSRIFLRCNGTAGACSKSRVPRRHSGAWVWLLRTARPVTEGFAPMMFRSSGRHESRASGCERGLEDKVDNELTRSVRVARGESHEGGGRKSVDLIGSLRLPIVGVGREVQLDSGTSMDFRTPTIYPADESRVPGMTRGVSRDAESGHVNG